MTDNEKRAHDLAIAWIPVMATWRRTNNPSPPDPIELYNELYAEILEDFSERYPAE